MAKYDIIQDKYADDPWKVLVCCILLNQTSNVQVRPLIEDFFMKWPTPFSISREKREAISSFIRTTGFQNVKADRILKFSNQWITGERDPKNFVGVGEYGREAWRIFVDKDFNFSPKDKKLKMYIDSL
jgi:methyl-CpG-binding domain protein 4